MSELHAAEPERGTVWDDYARSRDDDFAEHLRAAEDREREHRTDWKPAPRVKRSNMPRPDRLWRERVLERDQGCCVHRNPADCSEGFQAHHVIAQQELRRSRPDLLWHVSAGMGVCALAHRRHHSRVRPILFDEIPAAVVAFLEGEGFDGYLARRYP